MRLGVALLLAVAEVTQALSLPSVDRLWTSPTSNMKRSGPLGRRADKKTIPAAVSVAPSQYWDGIDGPWSSFPLQVGPTTNAQTVRTLVSTVGYNTWTIAADGCAGWLQEQIPDCANSRGLLYLTNSSATWTPVSSYMLSVEQNLGLDTAANVGFDTVTLGWKGSGGPSMPHSVVFNIADIKPSWLGMFGVNPMPTNFTSFSSPQPSFMEYAYQNEIIPSVSYGYSAGNQYQLGGLKVYGSLVLGGYDQNRFTAPNVSFPMYTDVSRDLLVNLRSVTTDSGIPSSLLPSGAIQIFIDSTVSWIYLPLDACLAFEAAFGIIYDEVSEFYLISSLQRQRLLSQNANVTFTISAYNDTGSDNTVDIVLPYGAFDLNISYPLIGSNGSASSFYFPLKRAVNSTQYTLGRAFLQEAYLISDYMRNNFTVAPCKWDSSLVNTEDIKSILSPNATATMANQSSSGFSAGAIAGVVVGVVAVIAIIAAILFLWRRKKQRKQRKAELEAKAVASESNDTKSSSRDEGNPMMANGELAGSEIHELNDPHKHFALEMDSPNKVLDPNKAGYSEMEGGAAGFYSPGKYGATEMHGDAPVYEMQGSEVHEMPNSQLPADGQRKDKPPT